MRAKKMKHASCRAVGKGLVRFLHLWKGKGLVRQKESGCTRKLRLMCLRPWLTVLAQAACHCLQAAAYMPCTLSWPRGLPICYANCHASYVNLLGSDFLAGGMTLRRNLSANAYAAISREHSPNVMTRSHPTWRVCWGFQRRTIVDGALAARKSMA